MTSRQHITFSVRHRDVTCRVRVSAQDDAAAVRGVIDSVLGVRSAGLILLEANGGRCGVSFLAVEDGAQYEVIAAAPQRDSEPAITALTPSGAIPPPQRTGEIKPTLRRIQELTRLRSTSSDAGSSVAEGEEAASVANGAPSVVSAAKLALPLGLGVVRDASRPDLNQSAASTHVDDVVSVLAPEETPVGAAVTDATFPTVPKLGDNVVVPGSDEAIPPAVVPAPAAQATAAQATAVEDDLSRSPLAAKNMTDLLGIIEGSEAIQAVPVFPRTGGEESSALTTHMKILTWNLWLRYSNWEERQEAILAELRELDADVLCLQEVWDMLNGTPTQAQILAEKLGYFHVYVGREIVRGVRCGNAILSRWEITRTASAELPYVQDYNEHAVVLFAEVKGPRGKIPVFVTHLNWRFDHSHVRQAQVTAVCQFVDEHVHALGLSFPPVLCGDFNSEPPSEEIRMVKGLTTPAYPETTFHDAWEVAVGMNTHAGAPIDGFTWDNTNPHAADCHEPNRRIDYVFAGMPESNGAGQVLSAAVRGNKQINGFWPSDHFAVEAILRY